MGLGRFEEAAKLLAHVHAAVPADEEACYYLGAAQAGLGRDADARRSLAQVRPASPFGAPAALQLAFAAARAGEYSASLGFLKPLLSARSGSVRPGALEVALLRRAGHPQEAREKLLAWRAIDPADSMLRFESGMLGPDDPELWTHLGADSERVLNLVDEYLSLGLDADALRLLDHSYPPVAPEDLEPGALPPHLNPLFFYYRAYCRARLGQNPSEDLKAAGGSSTRYAFPFRPSSIAVLKQALRANPSDAQARLLLGRAFLHSLMVDEAIAEWQAAGSLNPRLPELHRDLGKALIGPKKDPVVGLIVLKEGLALDPENPELRAELKRAGFAPLIAAAPDKAGSPADRPPSSPAEIASAAMLEAASGSADQAARRFDGRVFSAERQPDEVRKAYIEVQLRRLAAGASAGRCSDMADRLDRLGEEDRNLPFTFHGFRDFMKAPHFQYYLANIEESCRDNKNARKRWTKISAMNASLPSPEFVFPLLAGWRLNAEGAVPRLAAGLESVRAALANAQGASRLPLMFAEAVLLRVQGESKRAALQLQEVVKASQDVNLRYLAVLQLNEIFAPK